MIKIRKGDIVGRISYGKDILFRVAKIVTLKNGKKMAILKGISERIEASSYIEDLYPMPKEIVYNNLRSMDFKVEKRIEESRRQKKKDIKNENNRASEKIITGKILHLDRR